MEHEYEQKRFERACEAFYVELTPFLTADGEITYDVVINRELGYASAFQMSVKTAKDVFDLFEGSRYDVAETLIEDIGYDYKLGSDVGLDAFDFLCQEAGIDNGDCGNYAQWVRIIDFLKNSDNETYKNLYEQYKDRLDVMVFVNDPPNNVSLDELYQKQPEDIWFGMEEEVVTKLNEANLLDARDEDIIYDGHLAWVGRDACEGIRIFTDDTMSVRALNYTRDMESLERLAKVVVDLNKERSATKNKHEQTLE